MRLIDADALPKLLDAEYKQTMKLIWEGEKHLDTLAEGFAEAIHIAKYIATTVDAVPVVRGRWEAKGYVCGESEFECSVCHETEWRTTISQFKFCPFCGARMDGDSDAKAD